jgi:hypothetical protein
MLLRFLSLVFELDLVDFQAFSTSLLDWQSYCVLPKKLIVFEEACFRTDLFWDENERSPWTTIDLVVRNDCPWWSG